jgi:3-deoxy-manno-octulosonate cytidylyltransferase (CMP-KDO synthetase)
MLQWVYDCALASGAATVVIATDDDRIADAARTFGAPVQLTSLTHVSGTDRIAEVALQAGWGHDEVVVNLQGDEPLMPPALVRQVATLLEQQVTAHIATLATRITGLAAFMDPNVVKVVTDATGRALYFSRAPVPWGRDTAPAGMASQRAFAAARRHIGLYAYRVAALRRLSLLPPSPLEQVEKLEQLRALENGMEIRVADATETPGPDVNTAEDLARVALLLGTRSN